MAKYPKDEPQETSEDEALESPQKQLEEESAGVEKIPLPEDFQKCATDCVEQCSTLARCDFLSSLLSEKRNSLFEERQNLKTKLTPKSKGKEKPETFEDEEMPLE